MTVKIRDKIDRVKGLVQCLGLLVENEEAMNYNNKPHWYLVETIDEQLENVNEWLREADNL